MDVQRLKNQIAEFAVRVIANIITKHENQQSVKVMSEWKAGEINGISTCCWDCAHDIDNCLLFCSF